MKTRLRHAWIWFWYSDWTRLFVVLVPSYFIIVVPTLYALGVQGEALRQAVLFIYLGVFGWALLDNDYTRLEEIGLDAYRKPLTPSRVPQRQD